MPPEGFQEWSQRRMLHFMPSAALGSQAVKESFCSHKQQASLVSRRVSVLLITYLLSTENHSEAYSLFRPFVGTKKFDRQLLNTGLQHLESQGFLLPAVKCRTSAMELPPRGN